MYNRRHFLKASLAATGAFSLPTLGALGSLSAPSITGLGPRRFIFIRKGNGTYPNIYVPDTFSEAQKKMESEKQAFEVDLDKHQLQKWLSPIDKYKSNMSIIQGLSCKMSENGHFSFSSIMGAFRSGRNSISGIKRATIDFELAKLFPSPLGHVELSFSGKEGHVGFTPGISAGYSAPAAHQRNFAYQDPQTAYNEIFKAVVSPESVQSDTEIVKLLQQEEIFKAKHLPGYEKLKLSHHISSLEVLKNQNKELMKMTGDIKHKLPNIDQIHLNGGEKANTLQKQDAMTDVLTSALTTGLTNVVTYTIDTLSTPYTGLPGNEDDYVKLHNVGHSEEFGGVDALTIREKVRYQHMRQIEKMIEGLKATPEGSGNMFDNTMIMYFPEGGEAHHGRGTESPLLVLAGDNCKLDITGRYIRLPYHLSEGHKTISNWYTTLLNAHGNPIEHYGDFDVQMSSKKMAQAGAIKQFIS